MPFAFVAASSFFIRSAPSSAKAGLVSVRSAALAIIRRILRVCIIVEFLRKIFDCVTVSKMRRG
ncbi:hypothetical protein D9M72_568840 [compost metagenome]